MRTLAVLLATIGAGAFGSVLRFAVVKRAPVYGVHTVNILGTSVLALAVALVNRGTIDWTWAVVLGVGFSGAFTTFSTWIALIDDGRRTNFWRTVWRDVVAPSMLAVGATVAVFVLAS